MATTLHSDAHALTDRLVTRGDPGWDDARRVFNLTLDQRPAAVVLPSDERDVAAAVRFARARGLRVVPRATGHGAAFLGDVSDAVVVNTAPLQGVRIDADSRIVRVGAGVKWGAVAPTLSEIGLAALHGSSADVGIAGYSLGGGMGWLARRHGLQANSVTAIELVTADGDLVRADAVNEPELFWAVRGGGGNFGVVTAIEFRVYPLAEVYAGAFFYPFARSAEVFHAWSALMPAMPDDLMSWASIFHFPDLPEVPDPFRAASYAVVMAAYVGDEADGRDLLAPLAALGPEFDTFAMGPPAVLADLAMEDPLEPFPFETAHALLGPLDPWAIDALMEVAGPGAGGPRIDMVQLRQMGGAMSRAPEGAGARATLAGEYSFLALGVVEDPADAPAIGAQLGRMSAALAPWRAGDYPNFVERPADASRFFDAPTWRRLRGVKRLYDPADLFHGGHHIPPAD